MDDFKQALIGNGLHDMGWKGSRFTWCNHQECKNFTKEMLDIALANNAWLEQIGQTRVKVMTVGRSDHLLLFLSFSKQRQNLRKFKPLFWFEPSCITKVGGDQLIRDAWQPNHSDLGGDPRLSQRLDRCRNALRNWNSRNLRNGSRVLDGKSRNLKQLQSGVN